MMKPDGYAIQAKVLRTGRTSAEEVAVFKKRVEGRLKKEGRCPGCAMLRKLAAERPPSHAVEFQEGPPPSPVICETCHYMRSVLAFG